MTPLFLHLIVDRVIDSMDATSAAIHELPRCWDCHRPVASLATQAEMLCAVWCPIRLAGQAILAIVLKDYLRRREVVELCVLPLEQRATPPVRAHSPVPTR